MTPLEQTFWCQRFSKHRDNEDSILTPREAGIAADFDLEEFRKRFGGGDIPVPDCRTSLEARPKEVSK
jgi:hypothetical protein